MAYIGKYVDRNPCIKSAGIKSNVNETTRDTFKHYNLEEAAEEILRYKNKETLQTEIKHYVRPCPFLPDDNIRDLLSTELKKSRFVAFREKFAEDMFFKKPELGRVYPLHSKPENVTNESMMFGAQIETSEPLSDLIFPHKTPTEVNKNYVFFHDKYLLSHNHFLPGEQKFRNYEKKYFDPNGTFGIKHSKNVTGDNVKKCLTQCDQVIVISKVQKYYLERSMGRLGTKITKDKLIETEDSILGQNYIVDKCDVKALLENINPCIRRSKLTEAISHINKLRRFLFQRVNFNLNDLKLALEKEDNHNTGFLNITNIFKVVRSQFIRCDEEKVRTALRHFGLIKSTHQSTDMVNYAQFCKLLTIGYPLPSIGNISIMPKENYDKETTYRNLCKDLNKKTLPEEEITKNNFFEQKTTAKECISPDIPMLLGLKSIDFDIPRTKLQLLRIFKHIPEHIFEQFWLKAAKNKTSSYEMFSVNDFRKTLHEGTDENFIKHEVLK